MSLPIYVVDAFTVEGKLSFSGNPAAVCLLEFDVKVFKLYTCIVLILCSQDDIPDEQKQEIAMEMNLSETAFVAYGWTKGDKLTTAPGAEIERRTLRWFTPTTEVPLCGHATVASAKIIHEVQLDKVSKASISFESKFRGKLGANVEVDGSITLNFPSNPTHALNQKEHPWLENMLLNIFGNVENKPLNHFVQDVQYSPGTKILFIRLKDELKAEGLRNIKPNFQSMKDLDTDNFVRDVIVTVKGNGESKSPDFYSRFFAPWDGIDEDPVTGLAHTVLTPYWTKELGKNGPLKARQHSLRGGDLICTLLGDRVKLGGQARIGLRGQLFLS
jgi:PhzF family phenazine biosynthesis protein